MAVAQTIAALRRRAGLSQEALAERLDVSRQTVNKWESGVTAPDIDKVLAMSELFGVSTDTILKGDLPETGTDILVPEQEPAASGEPASAAAGEETAEPVTAPEGGEGEGYAPYGEAYRPAAEEEETAEEKDRSNLYKRIIAFGLVACIIIAAVAVPLFFGNLKSLWWRVNGGQVNYPYVLVHGLGGWGEEAGLNDVAPYWGATSGSLSEYLRGQGCEVAVPTVGPYSSTWDRTCELYAQLTGTQVDYGEAHAKAHNHERYGRTYSKPMVENWGEKMNGGQRVKINLVGHSFGGATVRMLAWLMANGSEAEQQATGKETSPLFTGGKADWIFSVTTLCAPHNGSQLTEIVDDLGGVAGMKNITQLLTNTLVKTLGSGLTDADLLLDQFGITNAAGNESGLSDVLQTLQGSGTDNALYELSPDGAAELNKTVKAVEDIYYFSYAYSTIREGGLLSKKSPRLNTLPVLRLTALAMANYTGTTDGGIAIDESWQDNDGLVSVVSARYPAGENHADFPKEAKEYETGIWYVAPTAEGDHGTVIGLNASAASTRDFYDKLTDMISSLER